MRHVGNEPTKNVKQNQTKINNNNNKKSNKIEFNKMLEHRLHIDDGDDNDKRRRAVASADKGGFKETAG